ncbi:MAG: hypothetical protein Q8R08_01615 [bacterium]|nr:hypothetical protein [bacterium]
MVKIRFDTSQLTSGLVVPLLVVVVAAVGYFLLLPKYKGLKENKQALAARQSDVALKEAQLSSVQDLIADLKKKQDEVVLLDGSLPDAPRVPELLSDIEALTLSSGLASSNLQITIPPALSKSDAGADAAKRFEAILGPTENLSVLQIDLIVSGNYNNLKTFLTNLEHNLRLMDILSLTFTKADEETGSQEFALKIQTYYHKP